MNINKAYALGFLLGDSHLQANGVIVCTLALKDKEILDRLKKDLPNASLRVSEKMDRQKKIFPNCSIYIPKRDFPDAKMLFGGNLKKDRHIPIISPELEKYLVFVRLLNFYLRHNDHFEIFQYPLVN